MFFDNIQIYSWTKEDHEKHLHHILETLKRDQLYAKRNKCSFFVEKVAYLGYIVSKDGMTADIAKIEVVNQWPIPKSISKVRGFLRLTGWCRIFIKGYAFIAGPLTQLTRKGKPFIWREERNHAFNSLKNALASDPVLKLPNFDKPFEVIVDACAQGIGGILQQEKHRIVYESCTLRVHERNYPTHDLELLAIIYALKKWRHYLLGQPFKLVTDHKSLNGYFPRHNSICNNSDGWNTFKNLTLKSPINQEGKIKLQMFLVEKCKFLQFSSSQIQC